MITHHMYHIHVDAGHTVIYVLVHAVLVTDALVHLRAAAGIVVTSTSVQAKRGVNLHVGSRVQLIRG
jgi:hypothetical protein